MTDRELLQQALEALNYHQDQTRPIATTADTLELIRARLAQAEQEETRQTQEMIARATKAAHGIKDKT